MKIPFSAYDFFGYLAAGFLLLAAADFAFDGHWLLEKDPTLVVSVLLVIVAYILGHIVAHLSAWLLEEKFLRGTLRSCEETLFEEKKKGGWSCLFPGYYQPFPNETKKRVLDKAKERAGIEEPSRGLFFHCHPIAIRQQASGARLAAFLNLYGFCRNVSMASILAATILSIGAIWHVDWRASEILSMFTDNTIDRLYWTLGALVAAIGMFYRYLKFFSHYTQEVFRAYAEAPPEAPATQAAKK